MKRVTLINNILLRDKSDLKGIEEYLPTAYIQGAMEKVNHDVQKIEVISNKFTKIGKTILDKYPNLKWIVYRGHGTDGINLELCKQYGVGVVATNPNTEGCAHWINDKLVDGNTIIFGNGSISKRLQELIRRLKLDPSRTGIVHNKIITLDNKIDKQIQRYKDSYTENEMKFVISQIPSNQRKVITRHINILR